MVTPTKPAPGTNNNNGCLVVSVIGVLIVLIGTYSKNSAPSGDAGNVSMTEQAAGNSMAASISSAVAAQAKGAVKPFSAADSGVGVSRERIAEKAEGLSGAMIYSQNCYDALTRSFHWSKLDQCGGFDAAAVARTDKTQETGLAKEIAYFDSETAAGRFLSAATAAGEGADEADVRWSKVQRRASGGGGRTVAAVSTTPTGSETRTRGPDPWKANRVLTAAEDAVAEAANAQR